MYNDVTIDNSHIGENEHYTCEMGCNGERERKKVREKNKERETSRYLALKLL